MSCPLLMARRCQPLSIYNCKHVPSPTPRTRPFHVWVSQRKGGPRPWQGGGQGIRPCSLTTQGLVCLLSGHASHLAADKEWWPHVIISKGAFSPRRISTRAPKRREVEAAATSSGHNTTAAAVSAGPKAQGTL